MRIYHVVLGNGSERDVAAHEVLVHNGSLVFRNEAGDDILIYSDTAWLACEVSRLDDKRSLPTMRALAAASPSRSACSSRPPRGRYIVSFGNITPNQFTATVNADGTTTLATTSNVNITQIFAGALDPDALLTFTATSTQDAQSLLGGTIISQRFAGRSR